MTTLICTLKGMQKKKKEEKIPSPYTWGMSSFPRVNIRLAVECNNNGNHGYICHKLLYDRLPVILSFGDNLCNAEAYKITKSNKP